jgi:hypothetical protein
MKKAPAASIICIEGVAMFQLPASLTLVIVVITQPVLAEICLSGVARDGSPLRDATAESIDEILKRDLDLLGVRFKDGAAYISSLSLGSSPDGKPMLTTDYTYYLEPGQNSLLHKLSGEQPDKIEVLFRRLNESLPRAVCGDLQRCGETVGPKPTAAFIGAGGVLRYRVSFWGDWDGSADFDLRPLTLPLVTITSCEAN